MRKTIYIVCEGASEKSYISEVVKYFRNEEGIDLHLVPKVAGSGHYVAIRDKYREVFQSQRRSPEIKIWVDKDIYLRNDKNNADNYRMHCQDGLPDFLFTSMNGEDFLTMHVDSFGKWEDICRKKGHFSSPMHENAYLPLIRGNIFPNYKKGELPFEICRERLKCLFENQNNNRGNEGAIHCDFSDFLKAVIQNAGITI